MYTAFISQFPPSESSKIREVSKRADLYNFLKYTRGIQGIKDVCWHEESGAAQCLVISLTKAFPAQAWQALKDTDVYDPLRCKIIIAVDDDIDARDPDSVIWALCYRMQPHKDILICPGKAASIDPSSHAPGEPLPPGYPEGDYPTSSILIDATRKWDFPPTALPAKEFMEKAKVIWEDLGLPRLTPKAPWYGRSLGDWSEQFEQEAELAVRGEYLKTGERLAKDERNEICS